MNDGVRCQNPKCRAKLAAWLNGEINIKCKSCGHVQTIVMHRKDATATVMANRSVPA